MQMDWLTAYHRTLGIGVRPVTWINPMPFNKQAQRARQDLVGL
jgi:hypothetical protein